MPPMIKAITAQNTQDMILIRLLASTSFKVPVSAIQLVTIPPNVAITNAIPAQYARLIFVNVKRRTTIHKNPNQTQVIGNAIFPNQEMDSSRK